MNQIKTIVFGGAFNPPTLAHRAILQAVLDHASLNDSEVWLLPSGDRPDKSIPIPRAKRLAYIDALLKDVERHGVTTEIIETELDRDILVETYDTVAEMQMNYPDREFWFVFGADSTETMLEWKAGQWLLDNLPMLVVARTGHDINAQAKLAVRLEVDTLPTSSTEVRARLAAGQSVEALVPATVLSLL